MGWDIRGALNPLPEEGEYVNRVESVELHVPEDSSKHPSVLFKLKIVSPEVPDNMQEQSTFRTLNPKWLKYLGEDIANANVIGIDPADNDLDPTDEADLVRKLDAMFAGKLFRYNLVHGSYNGKPSANWTLVGPAASF